MAAAETAASGTTHPPMPVANAIIDDADQAVRNHTITRAAYRIMSVASFSVRHASMAGEYRGSSNVRVIHSPYQQQLSHDVDRRDDLSSTGFSKRLVRASRIVPTLALMQGPLFERRILALAQPKPRR